MKTVHTYNKYPDPVSRYCDCNHISISYLLEVESGITWCTNCNILYEKRSGSNQVITMFKDVKRGEYPDRSKGVVVWDKEKSDGYVNRYINESVVTVELNSRVEEHRTLLSLIEPAKSKRDLYEEAYWKFVNSKTYDDAMYWKRQMEVQVDLALEPDGENWSSWVKDPETRKEVETDHPKMVWSPLQIVMGMLLLCGIAYCFVTALVLGGILS